MVCQIRLAGFPHFVQRVCVCESRLPTVLDIIYHGTAYKSLCRNVQIEAGE